MAAVIKIYAVPTRGRTTLISTGVGTEKEAETGSRAEARPITKDHCV